MNRFGNASWDMPGNIIQAERNNVSGAGYNSYDLLCPACGHRRQSIEHRKRKGLCSKELQALHYAKGGV